MWRSIINCVGLAVVPLLFCEAKAQPDNPYHLNGNAFKENCNCYTLTNDVLYQSGSVWNINKIDLNQSFDFKFNVYLGCSDSQGADGIAFVLQPISTSIGTSGGGIGYEGVIPSIGILIDTWQNVEDNDPSADHIAIHKNGNIDHSPTNDVAAPVSALASGGNIEDCNWHTLRIIWNAPSKSLKTEIDGVARVQATVDLVTDVFGNDPMVFWGFTAATGGASNHQRICTSLNPGFYFPSEQEMCFPATLNFIDSSHSFGTIDKWYWDFGDGTQDTVSNPPPHVFAQPGIYDVKLSILGNNGCVSDTFLRKVVVGSKPMANFTSFPSQVCKGLPVTFADSSYVAVGTIDKWSWTIEGQSFTDKNPPAMVLNNPKNKIELSVETLEGCVSEVFSDSVIVQPRPCPEFYVPSAFSPNNDGKNDRFQFTAAGMASIEYLRIFNRYGQLIYSTDDVQGSWDGRLNGIDQPSATYIWVIKGTDLNNATHFKKGTVTLVR